MCWRSNRLSSIPPEIGKLVELRELVLSNNLLQSLPCEVGGLFQLQKLGLAGNPLSGLLLQYALESTSALLTYLLDNSESTHKNFNAFLFCIVTDFGSFPTQSWRNLRSVLGYRPSTHRSTRLKDSQSSATMSSATSTQHVSCTVIAPLGHSTGTTARSAFFTSSKCHGMKNILCVFVFFCVRVSLRGVSQCVSHNAVSSLCLQCGCDLPSRGWFGTVYRVFPTETARFGLRRNLQAQVTRTHNERRAAQTR